MTLSVLCIGAAHWDVIAQASRRLSIGADVPGKVIRRPGGVALNVARALNGLGARCRLAACFGRDAQGLALEEQLVSEGIDLSASLHLAQGGDSYIAIETDGGALYAAVADDRCAQAGAAELAGGLTTDGADMVFLDAQFPAPALEAIAARVPPDRLCLNPVSPAKAPAIRRALMPGAMLYCNLAEAAVLLENEAGDTAIAASALQSMFGCRALVTDGAQAAAYHDGRLCQATPPVSSGSVTGAGDALIGAHMMAMHQRMAADVALEHALAAAVAHMSNSAT